MILVDMLSKIILINRNSIGVQHNHNTCVFQVPVEDLNKVTEKLQEDLKSEAGDDDDE